MKLTFIGKQNLQGEVTKFSFSVPDTITWQPGQFIHYTLPHDNADDRGIERWFTISSAPFENEITITTRIDKKNGSTFKQALSSLEPGDTIEADTPEGDFTLTSDDAVFIVGGIGITPLRSILRQLDHDKTTATIRLLYANRNASTEPYKSFLEAYATDHDEFTITNFYGDQSIDEPAIKTASTTLTNPTYYVTGPEPMVNTYKDMLKKMGINEQRIKLDFFPGYTEETQ